MKVEVAMAIHHFGSAQASKEARQRLRHPVKIEWSLQIAKPIGSLSTHLKTRALSGLCLRRRNLWRSQNRASWA